MITRRRYMGGTRGDSPEYIQDGLIFWLDGINKGASDGTWVDIIMGNVYRKLDGTVTSTEQGFAFNGGRMSGNWVFGGNANFTVEVCCRNNGDIIPVFGVGGNGHLTPALVYRNNNLFWTQNMAQYTVPSSVSKQIFTVSCNNSRAIMNRVALTKTSADYWAMSPNNVTMYIGGGYSGGATTWRMNGIIHSIRIYRRQLSEEEILHNQDIDNTRFGLQI